MSEEDRGYELKVLKMMLNKYLDETVSVTEAGLRSLEANRDRVVWELATKIYSHSGHKVELCTARDVVNSRIGVIDAKLTAEKKRIEAQIAEQAHQAAETKRIAAEKERILAETKRILAEKIHMECLNEVDSFVKVQKIISEQLSVDKNEVHLESHLSNDLGADELDLVELVMALEEEFDIEIPYEVAEEISTVQSAVALIIYAKFSA